MYSNSRKNSDDIKVSVCVITYNQASYIRECLESIIQQQTDFEYEIIIRDDASTDNTPEIIREFQIRYPFIKVLDGSVNLGMNKNILEVFNAAQGNYLALCEGDDYWIDSEKLQKQWVVLEGNKDIDLCCHPALIKQGSKVSGHRKVGAYSKSFAFIPVYEIIANNGSFIATPSLMIRKSVVARLPGWFSSAPLGDYFIQIYAALSGGGIYLPNAMAVYRKNALGSWSINMQSYHLKRKFYDEMLFYLQLLSKELNDQFESEINLFASKMALGLAVSALSCSVKEDFVRLVNTSWQLNQGFSNSQKVFYYFRQYPFLLSVMYRLVRLLYKG